MIANHPVAIEVWRHKRLPAHTLCLSHVKHGGKQRCLAVPATEAATYLANLERFIGRDIAVSIKRHAAIEAARPAPRHPKSKIPKRIKLPTAFLRPSKLHRHAVGATCLIEMTGMLDPGWFRCSVSNAPIHVHSTRRGRRFLMDHDPDDGARCPAIVARRAAEAAARKTSEASMD